MLKKILIAILFILILALVGWLIISNKNGAQGSDDVNSDSGSGAFGGFFPFGNSEPSEEDDRVPSPDSNTEVKDDVVVGNNTSGLILRKIVDAPIAGYISTSTSAGLKVRYVEKEKGNVYEVDMKSTQLERLTNTTLQFVAEAIWNRDATTFILRHVDKKNVIKSQVASIAANNSSTTSEFDSIVGEFIHDDVQEITTNPSKTKLLYTLYDRSGSVARSSLFDSDTTNDDGIFSSPFSEWKLEWVNQDLITANSKASFKTPGYLYFVDPNSGEFIKIIGEIDGLMSSTNETGNFVVYSGHFDKDYESFIYRVSDKSSEKLSFSLLPEKCAWSTLKTTIVYCGVPDSDFDKETPDNWYKGITTFSDNIWMIDVESNIVKLLATPAEVVEEEIDLIDPEVIGDGSHLIFKNKKDSTLWSLELPEIVEEVVEEEIEEEEVEEVAS